MSLQIQLKKSAVSQKQPFASDLAIGELALNYNANGPFLTCKDSAGNVRKLNNVWVATAAPNNPSAGDLWLDTSAATAVLKVYKSSVSGWVNATTIPVASTTIFGTVQLATAADITNGTAGKVVDAAQLQSKISAELSANPITFQGVNVVNNVTIGGDLTVNGTQTIINTTTLDVEDKNIVIGNVATPSNTTADGGGISLLGATTKTLNWVNATGAWTSSERFSVPVGSAAAPSLTFTGRSAGIYSPGADQLALSTGGLGRLFISSTGNVTVDSADALLNLKATSAGSYTNKGIRFAVDGTDYAHIYNEGVGNIVFRTSSGLSERLRITSAGLVGIGTSAPGYALTVGSASPTFDRVAQFNSNTANSFLGFGTTGGTGEFAAEIGAAGSDAVINTQNTERLRVTAAGNVGIGTANPITPLDVVGAIRSQIGTIDARLQAGYSGAVGIGAQSNDAVLFIQNATERARIDSSGRLLVGTSTSRGGSNTVEGVNFGGSSISLVRNQATSEPPVFVLAKTRGTAVGQNTVVADGDFLGIIDFKGADGANLQSGAYISAFVDGTPGTNSMPGRIVLSTTASGASSPTERLRITSAGNVGIGTSSPRVKLQVQGGDVVNDVSVGTSSSTFEVVSDVLTNNGQDAAPGISFRAPYASALPAERISYAAIWSKKESASQGSQSGALVIGTNSGSSTGVTEKMRITSAGRVGIGTASPTSLLDVRATSGNVDTYIGVGDVSLARIRVGYQGTGFAGTADGGAVTADSLGSVNLATRSGVANNIAFATSTGTGAATERARIDSSGRLLVGTSTALSTDGNAGFAPLHVNGLGAALYRYQATGNGPVISFGLSRSNTTGTNTIVADGDNLGQLQFNGADGTNFVRAALITAAVDGTPGTNSMPGRIVLSTTASGASTPTERMRIASNGQVNFTNSPGLVPVPDNALGFGTASFRWAVIYAANGTIQTSDERAKTDISSATLGTDFIKALRPVSYKWIEGGKRDTGERDENNNYIYETVPGERTHWGFIAQEVKQAVDAAGVDFGGWVLTDKDDPDSQQALRYDQFIAPLTKALQEALEKIESLEARLTAAGI